MTVLDAGLEFSDAQSVVIASSSSTLTTVVSTNIIDLGTGQLDGWDDAKSPELGDSVWNVNVNVALVGAGGIMTASLVTKAADASISSGGTTKVSIVIPATTVAGTKYAIKLPTGFELLRYTGIIFSGAAAISASKIDSWIGLDNEVPG